MRLFRLELKRILKSRRTLILLAIALLLSVAMAYLPISFESINRPNEDGTVTELDGLEAIKYKQDLYKTSAGEVTPDRIKSALETYQSCVREYGPVEEEGFPLAVFIEKIVPFRHLLMGLPETFAVRGDEIGIIQRGERGTALQLVTVRIGEQRSQQRLQIDDRDRML